MARNAGRKRVPFDFLILSVVKQLGGLIAPDMRAELLVTYRAGWIEGVDEDWLCVRPTDADNEFFERAHGPGVLG